tara:strand:+ start:770 stop:1738 length:969 start_codon:yes stop_codon:yes gene_type:complete
MAYLPQNRYEKLHTNGREYRLEKTNKPYIGSYIITSDGKIYAGDSPQSLIGKLIPIIQIGKTNNINEVPINNRIYSILKPRRANRQDKYIPFPTSEPTPKAIDYSKGFFNRYIAVRLNTKSYSEISREIFENFKTHEYNSDLYKVFNILWSLKENNEEENIKNLRNLEIKLPGITKFFPNKSQYALKRGVINISPTSRTYPDSTVISKSLPAAYQIGNSKINTIDNPSVPELQHCHNCIFFQNKYCNAWKAQVRNNYWCRKWESIQNQPPTDLPTIPNPLVTDEGDPSFVDGYSKSPPIPPSQKSTPTSTPSMPPSREGGGY